VPAGPSRAAATLAEAETALAQVVTVRRGDGVSVARGSAFFIDADGHLLTCAHVLDHMPSDEAPRLRLRDGRERRFQIVRVDEETDLALLLSDAPERFLALGEAPRPDVGQEVLMAGFAARAGVDSGVPPQFKRAAVVGLERRWASGARRTIGSRRRIVTVKVDAIADPGQSGGPLLTDGTFAVIGVLRANLEKAPGGLGGLPAQGYGAAVPLMYVKPFIAEIE
jgi:S1-C subfamily serine protease